MNIYELNAQCYKNAEPLPPNIKEDMKAQIAKFIIAAPDKYFLALGYDQRYYTIFHFAYKMMMGTDIEAIYSSIENCCGTILDIAVNEHEVEFWYRDQEDNEPKIVLFFPYDLGVIECA